MSNIKTLDSKRYLESFIKEVKDYKDLSTIDFFIKYCTSGNEEEQIKEQYNDYIKLNDDIYPDDLLSYKDWLEEVYYKENEDDIYERVREYREPNIELIVYKSDNNDYKIYEITLSWGGPNIYLTLNSRLVRATYEFYWGGDILKEDLSYMYDEIYEYLNLDSYE